VYVKVSSMNPDVHTAQQLHQGLSYIWACIMDDEASQICGAALVDDLSGIGFAEAMRLRELQSNQKDEFYYMQNCMPLRFKGIHLVHQPWWATMLLNVSRPFMSKKIRSRVCLFVCLFVFLSKRTTLFPNQRSNAVIAVLPRLQP